MFATCDSCGGTSDSPAQRTWREHVKLTPCCISEDSLLQAFIRAPFDICKSRVPSDAAYSILYPRSGHCGAIAPCPMGHAHIVRAIGPHTCAGLGIARLFTDSRYAVPELAAPTVPLHIWPRHDATALQSWPGLLARTVLSGELTFRAKTQ